jgi:AAA family ATP:ADP antiporter
MSTKDINSSSQSYFLYAVNLLFPIKKENLEKVTILFCLFFLAGFVYNILYPLKKTIILYTPGAGSEAMPYLKPFAVVPGAFMLTWGFLALARRFNRDTVFKIMLLGFIGYFMLYTFVFIPYQDFFLLNSVADGLLEILPESFHSAPSLIRYWMHTLFYTISELWSPIIMSLLLWGLVNEISSQE